MNGEVSGKDRGLTLFRHSAVRSVGHRWFGHVAVVVPPSGKAALLIAILSLGGLVASTWMVVVPIRSRAIGVLMPPGGFIEVISDRSGRVIDVFAKEGQLVSKEQLFITVGPGEQLSGRSASEENLRSLQNELKLLEEAHSSRKDIAIGHLVALNEQLRAAVNELDIAEQKQSALVTGLAILEERIQRLATLVRGGHVSRDAFEIEQLNYLRARAERLEFRRTIAKISLAIQTTSRLQAETQQQIDLNTIEHALDMERVRREIERVRHDVLQEFRAPEHSIAARILVQRGDTVRAGQVLARLRPPGEQLQAWLYVSTSSARLLRPGQTVEISLDAYPREAFGTRTATVTSVSGSALLPKDIQAPLLLAGPVFEVKAEIGEADVTPGGESWPLTPGISFSADIIQRRLRLYEFLLRSRPGSHG